jgi:hypothetical protein
MATACFFFAVSIPRKTSLYFPMVRTSCAEALLGPPGNPRAFYGTSGRAASPRSTTDITSRRRVSAQGATSVPTSICRPTEDCSAGTLPDVGGSASSSYTTSWDTTCADGIRHASSDRDWDSRRAMPTCCALRYSTQLGTAKMICARPTSTSPANAICWTLK